MMPALICATPRAPKAPRRGLRRRSPRLEAVARNGNGESELEGRARLAESNSDKCQRARLHRREFRERRRRQTAAASLLLCQCRRQPASPHGHELYYIHRGNVQAVGATYSTTHSPCCRPSTGRPNPICSPSRRGRWHHGPCGTCTSVPSEGRAAQPSSGSSTGSTARRR